MDFSIPDDVLQKLEELDAFIEAEIEPLEREHMQFFDHRREYARTNWKNDGVPSPEWEALLAEMRRRADAAGHLRYALPSALGGADGSNGRGEDRPTRPDGPATALNRAVAPASRR